jgi:hypothetical protein
MLGVEEESIAAITPSIKKMLIKIITMLARKKPTIEPNTTRQNLRPRDSSLR